MCVCLTFNSSCSHRPLTYTEFVDWLRDPEHGLSISKETEQIGLRLQYVPNEELVMRDCKADPNSMEFLNQLNKHKDSYTFHLQLKALRSNDLLSAATSDPEVYYQRQYYFNALVQDDLSLVIGTDTLPCALAHFERTYGAVPYNTLVISFVDDRELNAISDLKFVYYDRAFGLGPLEFLIAKENILNIPELIRS